MNTENYIDIDNSLRKPKPKTVAKAYCGSEYCAKNKNYVEKKVKRNKFWCPDCSSALFWDSGSPNKLGLN